MPGPILHLGAQVFCSHAGTAIPTVTSPRVTVSGQPVVTMPAPWVVAGCPLPAPPGPCLTAVFLTAATRVTSMGMPVLLMDSIALCAPPPTPLVPVVCQTRAVGT